MGRSFWERYCAGGKKEEKKIEYKIDPNASCEESIVITNPGDIHEIYDIEKKRFAEGSFAAVYRGVNKSTQWTRAIKFCSIRNKEDMATFENEIELMKDVDHPNIVKFCESFKDGKFIYIVMELMRGKELADSIVEMGHFPEQPAAVMMQQVLRAVNYLHWKEICHRDLKPENFVFFNGAPIEENTIKIIDFGLATQFEPGKPMTLKCGAPYYVSPQVLAGRYDEKVDVWTCGVLMYILLCGYPPFFGNSDADVMSKVRIGNFQFNQADWKSISEEAKQLLRNMLKMNPLERFSAQNALHHDWIKNRVPHHTDVPLKVLLVPMLRKFAGFNRLKKAALYVIAQHLTEEVLKKQKDSFNALDVEGDGSLGLGELEDGLRRAGLSDIPEDLPQVMRDLDTDGSGKIEYTEFLAATVDQKYIQEDLCWTAFRVFDLNGDGKISQIELFHVFNGKITDPALKVKPREVIEFMRTIDNSDDGYLDFDEFIVMMKGGDKSLKE